MLSQKLHDAINAQINAELWSAYLYLAMSLDAENKGYKGVANWFYVQFQEEQAHALRALQGRLMAKSGGRADPVLGERILLSLLSASPSEE